MDEIMIKKNEIIYVFLVYFLIGVIFLLISSYISEILKTENYIFDLDVSKTENVTYFNCFNLNYDFTLNSGFITFLVDNNTYFNSVNIEFPKLIKNVRFNIQPDQNILKKIKNQKFSQVILSNFSQQVEGYNITIYFESDMSPNAYFQVFSRPNKLVMYAGCGPAVNFKLGDKYNCVGRCFVPFMGVEEHPLSSQKEIKVKFKDDEIYDNHRFKIESIQNYKLFQNDKEFFFGLGVSFVSASLIFLISCLTYRNRKTRKAESF